MKSAAMRYQSEREFAKYPVICPECRIDGHEVFLGDLTLIADHEVENLTCGRCGRGYPVTDGIPTLISEEARKPVSMSSTEIDSEHEKYQTQATKRIARLVAKYSNGIALDIGCAKGPYSSYYRGDAVLVDIDFYFVKEALRRYRGANRVFGVVADARRLPFPPSSYDFVLCSNLIEHLPEDSLTSTIAALSAIARCRLQIDVPNEAGLIAVLRSLLIKKGVYKVDTFTDKALEHHSRLSPRFLKDQGLQVRGCIGWVTRERMRLGLMWDLYDSLTWRFPWLAGTLVGILEKDGA